MLEIAQEFEQMAGPLNPAVLIVLGSAAVLAGLFVWLGGLGFRRVLVALVGAVSGGACGFFMGGQRVVPAIAAAAVAAVIAVIFERIFITILAAALAVISSFVVLANPYIENATSLKELCLHMPVYRWVIIAALAVVFIIAGVYIWRLISALCCSALGTILVFAGMILLLTYKAAVPLSHIGSKPSFYAAVFLAMIAFGTVEQLLLCRRPKGPIARKKADKNEKTTDRTRPNWRTT